jgi:sugar phosphate isomerase/epimerase
MSEDLEEALQLGLEAGVDTVHLRKDLFGKEIQDITPEDIPRIQDTLGKFGARVGVLMPPFAKCDIEDTEKIALHHEMFARITQTAKALGTDLVRCFPFGGANDVEYSPARIDDYLGRIVENLLPSVRHAESEGITMCFEVVNSTIARTAADTRKVIDTLDSDAAKVIWEIDTAWRVGEQPSEGYNQIKGLIRDIHIKPNDKGEMDPVGDTGEKHADVIRQLHADSYDGYITIEHWKGQKGILKGLHQLTETLAALP